MRMRPSRLFCAAFVLLLTGAACAASAAQEEKKELVLLYTADMHGYIFAEDGAIGMDRIAALRKNTPHALLLDAGDFLHGQPAAVLGKGKDIVALMLDAGYVAAALGNHEFSYDLATLNARHAEAERGAPPMHMLSSNVVLADGTPLVQPTVSTLVDGIKVCLFGLTTRNAAISTTPAASAGLVFADEITHARAQTRALRAGGCDLIVALAHVGVALHAEAYAPLTDGIDGLDVIIDGHAHRELHHEGRTGTLTVSPGAHGKKIGLLRLGLDPATRRVIQKNNTLLDPAALAYLTPDAPTAARLASVREAVQASLAMPVARVAYDLDGALARIRTAETNLGNLCADAMRQALGTDLALVNAGSLRASIKAGEVTRKDMLTVLPFANAVIAARVSGAEFLAMLEHGLARLPEPSGRFPQLSGCTVRIAPANPPGARVLAVTLADGAPLDPSGVYTLALNDFVADGGDGYPRQAESLRLRTLPSLADVVTAYLHTTHGREHAPGPARRMMIPKN